jgi:hypothetical protein
MNRLLTFLFLFAFAANADAQMSKITFSFDHKVGTSPLVLGQTQFTIWNGKKTVISRAEFYISEITLKKQNGTLQPLANKYIHVNAATPNIEYNLDTLDVQSVQSVTLHLGVDSARNHLDPASYPQTHPLAYKNPSMHWGWAAGYRFMAIEGVIDNNNDGSPETPFQFHNFNDTLYKKLTVETLKSSVNSVLNLRFTLDYAQLFKNIPMTGNILLHGGYALNDKMMTNGATENFITFGSTTPTENLSANAEKVQIAPNPFATETAIRYDLPTKNTVNLVIVNVLGQVVRTVQNLPNSGSMRFEKGNLSNGIYQVVFYENNTFLARKKLIISE